MVRRREDFDRDQRWRHSSHQPGAHARLPSRRASEPTDSKATHSGRRSHLGATNMRNAVGMLVKPRWLVLLSAAMLTIAAAPLRSADLPHGYLPPAYAIQGAKIVTGTGTPIEKGTVVVRNGLIE